MVALATPATQILSLYRYAVKGLGPGDPLPLVHFTSPGETFPDDRRYALIKDDEQSSFDPSSPEWLHKGNFLCAFSRPALLCTFDTKYEISQDERRFLTVWKRPHERSSPPILGPIDLCTSTGQNELSSFFSQACGDKVSCVTASSPTHTHQFGNTSSGVKQRNDTRTIHIINAATVRQVSEAFGIPLNPERFRPNVVIDGMDPWEEFKCVGGTLRGEEVVFDVIARTVRCEGVSVDPYDLGRDSLDVPKLLAKHFPEHGPYLGVYAVVREAGTLKVGERLKYLRGEDY